MPADDIVLAILLVGDRYLLQLRDDKPEIDAPGVWGLFGGKVEPLEAPPDALTREIREELCVELPGSRFLWTVEEPAQYQRQARRYWFFEADFSGCWGSHHLTEGAAAWCFTFDGMAAVDMPAIARDALSCYRLTKFGSSVSCRLARYRPV